MFLQRISSATLTRPELPRASSIKFVISEFCEEFLSTNLFKFVIFRILGILNADADEYSVIFTSGATASLKLVGESFKFNEDGAFFYLTDSHTSVLGMREIVQTKLIVPVTKQNLNDQNFETNSGLITFPAQCNFNGFKFSLDLIKKFHENPEMFVCLDAASYVATNVLDLGRFKPDYVCLSFYKIFGYPTGLGALLVSKRGAERLEKKYYGGGTVKIALTRTNWHQKRDLIHERFEDGTIPFLSIIALQSGFKFMQNLFGLDFMNRISRHVFNLGKYLYHQLKALTHQNGQPVILFHHDTEFDNQTTQGGILNFSLRHADGSFVGFAEFASIAALHSIVLRTGCFCNPGSCQSHFQLSSDDLMKQFNSGHVCGDDNDLIDGAPTGSNRVSFGYMTTKENVDKLLHVIKECYAESSERIRNHKNDAEKEDTGKARLKSIRIYPIKSCGAMVINDSWNVTTRGLKYDREWIIINGHNGTSMTQKNETQMCMIQPFVDEIKKILRLEFPNMTSIEIPLDNKTKETREAKICETKVCGDRIQGVDCGDEIAKWISVALSIEGLRLIKQTENVERKNGTISLSNQAQFLLVSEPSVKWLMDQVEMWEDSVKDVENIVSRFRGNLVIDSLEPLAENSLKSFTIGKIKFNVQGPCTRCQMICIDQNTGQKTTEPLRTIGKVFKGKMRFGIYLNHSSTEQLTLTCGNILSPSVK